MLMEIITSLNLVASNIAIIADKKHEGPKQPIVHASGKEGKDEKCGDGLVVDGLCDPICEQIFSDKRNREETLKEVNRVFKETINCDGVCTCICEAICDEFM